MLKFVRCFWWGRVGCGVAIQNAAEFLAPQCLHKFFAINQCSLCSGHFWARPCLQLCRTVLAECFAAFHRVYLPWRRFIDFVRRHILLSLQSEKSMCTKLEEIHATLFEIMNHFELGRHDVETAVADAVTTEIKVIREDASSSHKLLDFNYLKSTSKNNCKKEESQFQKVIQFYSFEMLMQKSVWSDFPDGICVDFNLAASWDQSDACWNGTHLSTFNFKNCANCHFKTERLSGKANEILQNLMSDLNQQTEMSSQLFEFMAQESTDFYKYVFIPSQPKVSQKNKPIYSHFEDRPPTHQPMPTKSHYTSPTTDASSSSDGKTSGAAAGFVAVVPQTDFATPRAAGHDENDYDHVLFLNLKKPRSPQDYAINSAAAERTTCSLFFACLIYAELLVLAAL